MPKGKKNSTKSGAENNEQQIQPLQRPKGFEMEFTLENGST